jgi:hypothetical protein
MSNEYKFSQNLEYFRAFGGYYSREDTNEGNMINTEVA